MLLLLLATLSHADEGMWLPEQLPALRDSLVELGLEMPVEQLADPLSHPMAAVGWLGGCTASFVSPEGLIFTNHHCVSGYLQYNSTAEADRGRDGYLATSREEELWAGPGARMVVVERIEDVTDRVHKALGKRTRDARRVELLDRVKSKLVSECEVDEGTRCRVASFEGGREYRLFVGRELRDLRLVYAPPRSVGQFGGDIDNWMWPRHGADVGILRAYVAPDGSSAEYSPDNVPYQPPDYLQVSWEGVREGDFVMAMGYPGSTARYRTASELEHTLEVAVPFRVGLLDELLGVLHEHADADAEAAARLSAPIDWLGNSRKYYFGLGQGLERSGALAAREQREAELRAWIDADPERVRTYASDLDELEALLAARHAEYAQRQLFAWTLRTVDLLRAAHTAYRLSLERTKPDLQREPGLQARDEERIRASLERLDNTLWLPAERDLFAVLQQRVAALPEEQRIPPLVEADLNALFDAPALAEHDARLALLDMEPADFESSDDPWIQLAVAVERWEAPRREADKAWEGAMLRVRPAYMAALTAKETGPIYYDANDTLRVTVGTVQGAVARDGLYYLPFTSLSGLVAKAGPPPFDAPPALVERARKGPSSDWAEAWLGDVPVDFLTTLDSTGGNSGSPTLDAQGRLVGLLFDGTIESIAADWVFEPELTRSIHVDIRYLGWLLEGEEGAAWILDELGRE